MARVGKSAVAILDETSVAVATVGVVPGRVLSPAATVGHYLWLVESTLDNPDAESPIGSTACQVESTGCGHIVLVRHPRQSFSALSMEGQRKEPALQPGPVATRTRFTVAGCLPARVLQTS